MVLLKKMHIMLKQKNWDKMPDITNVDTNTTFNTKTNEVKK